jgi:predicted 2-oxoglutarate/Fe(II)-dependent dioxygenase YbiX
VAISVNLNEDYEGGELRFPEYSPHLYRAPGGSAIVFPCELLHEVLPVTRGMRYAVTMFLAEKPPTPKRATSRLGTAPFERAIFGL